jgi:ABC-2 type transport system permease protein
MSSTYLEAGGGFTDAGAMSRLQILRAYLTEAKYESIRMLRMPSFGIPLLALPVMLFLLFGVLIFGKDVQGDPDAAKWLFTAFAVMGVMGPGMFGFGVSLAIEREQGLLKLKRALPMPPAAYLVAKMFMALAFGAIIMATMIAALPVGHVPLSARQVFGVTAINILGALPFCAIGLFIGTLATGRSAPAFVNLLYQAMMHLSGLFYPLPKVLRAIRPIWPTYHLQQLVLWAAKSPSVGTPIGHAAVLAGLTAVLVAFSVRRLARIG